MNHFVGSTKSFYTFKSNSFPYIDRLHGKACFFDSIEDWDDCSDGIGYQENIEMELFIYKKWTIQNSETSHRTLLSKKELIIWFDLLREIFPYTYTLDEADDYKYVMYINIAKANKAQYLWLLTGIRNVYESKSAIILKEVFSLVQYKLISTHNLVNIFKILWSYTNYGSSQTWFDTSDFILLRSVEDHKKAVLAQYCDDQIQDLDESGISKIYMPDYLRVYDKTHEENRFNRINVFKRYIKYWLPMIKYYKEKNMLLKEISYAE